MMMNKKIIMGMILMFSMKAMAADMTLVDLLPAPAVANKIFEPLLGTNGYFTTNHTEKAPAIDNNSNGTLYWAQEPLTGASGWSTNLVNTGLNTPFTKTQLYKKWIKAKESPEILNFSKVLQPDQISKVNPEDLYNSDHLIRLIVQPLSEKLDTDSDKGAEQLTNQALLSIPLHALSDMVARRQNQSDIVKKSVMTVMREQVQNRIKDNTWATGLSGLHSEAVLKEIAFMQAENLHMQYQNYRLQEQMVALLSVITSLQAQASPGFVELGKKIKELTEKIDESMAQTGT